MKNFKKVLSLALALLMVVGCMAVAPVETKAATTYQLVESVDELTAGVQFVIVASYSGKYYVCGAKDGSKGYKPAEASLDDLSNADVFQVEEGSAAGKIKIKTQYGYLAANPNNSTVKNNLLFETADAASDWIVSAGASANTFKFNLDGFDRYISLNASNSTNQYIRQYTDKSNDSKYVVSFSVYKLVVEEGGDNTDPVVPVLPVTTIAEALATETGTKSKVVGIVTLVDGKNIYIQDATGGIDAYFATAPTDIQVGDVLEVEGERAEYRGLPELASATYVKSDSLMTLTAKETTIGALTTADICTYVSLKGLTVTAVDDNNGAYTVPNVTVTDGTNEIQIYKAVVDKVDGEWAIKVGDTVDVVAAVSTYYQTLQLRTNAASDITVLVVEDDNTGDDNTGDVEEVVAKGTYDCINTWWGGATNIVCYVSDAGTVADMEVSKMGAAPEGGFPWWTAVVLELQEDGNYVVKEIYAADGTNDKLGLALTTGRLIINYHSGATNQDSIAFFNSLVVGDVLAADATYTEIVEITKVANFTKVVVEDDTTGDDTTGDEGNTGNEDDTTDEEIKNTGDNFVPMFVVLFAGLALVAVAVVGKRRMA